MKRGRRWLACVSAAEATVLRNTTMQDMCPPTDGSLDGRDALRVLAFSHFSANFHRSMPHSDPPYPPQPFPRAVEVDKPEDEAYRIVSVAQPLGESAAPLLRQVLMELTARGETRVQLHVDVATNHFTLDPRLEAPQPHAKDFIVVELALATKLLLGHHG
jgi:hypothetical protein